jgi:hypothetical protein
VLVHPVADRQAQIFERSGIRYGRRCPTIEEDKTMQGCLSIMSTQPPLRLARATEHNILMITSLKLKHVQVIVARPRELRVLLEVSAYVAGEGLSLVRERIGVVLRVAKRVAYLVGYLRKVGV